MKTTAKEARETTVFVRDFNGEIEETNLYDHVMRSNNETTSPRGVMPIKFYEEVDGYYRNKETGEDVDIHEEDDIDMKNIEPYSLFIVYKWYFQKKQEVARFETEEEADNYLFEWVYDYDFQKDDQRSTQYFYTLEDIEEDEAEMMCLNVEAYRSVKRKGEFVKEQRALKAQKEREEINISRHNLAIAYANTIPLVNGETKQETQTRISKLLGRIEKDVFWRVVQIVRSRQNN